LIESGSTCQTDDVTPPRTTAESLKLRPPSGSSRAPPPSPPEPSTGLSLPAGGVALPCPGCGSGCGSGSGFGALRAEQQGQYLLKSTFRVQFTEMFCIPEQKQQHALHSWIQVYLPVYPPVYYLCITCVFTCVLPVY